MELSFPQGSKTDVSVIVPVYGCRDCLESLLERVCAVLRSSGRTFEILLVDDFSTDGGWNLIEEISRSTTEVRGIRLSRNFGQHIAIMAGLRESRGESMVVMDCDLQDPPELIPDLLRGLMSHQVAIAVKIGKHQSYVRRLQARVYGKVLNVVTGLQTTNGLSGFVALRRAVVDQYVKFSEPDQHLLHILQWLGFDAMHIAYERPAREVGQSSYGFWSRARHALRGLLFETSRLLYIFASLGITIAISGLAGVVFVLARSVGGNSISGWPSTISAVVFLGGVSIFIQSIIGLYVARTFQLSKNRPLYVIGERTDH